MWRKIKNIIPDSLKSGIKGWLAGKKMSGWNGDFSDWASAAKKSSGYDNEAILQKVKNAVLKVKSGEAKYERDSVLFDEPYFFEPVVKAIQNSIQNKRLHVCDFGGSLGSTYFQFRDLLKEVEDLKWTVVEQKHFVDVGKKEIASGQLAFAYTVEEALKQQSNQLLLLSSVLQYVPDPRALVKQLISYRFEYILIDRTGIVGRDTDRIAIQVVPPEIYTASYPCWFFTENNFLHLFTEAYVLLESFTDEIPPPMMLDGDAVSWKGYYLKRKDG